MLLQKMFADVCACVVYACMLSCVTCMCACVHPCVCACARDSHGIVMDLYDVARLFLSTNKRKGEKDWEGKRIETS